MKLFELGATNKTKQAAKVFESYFGNRVDFATVTGKQARTMLSRVRELVKEHRRTPEFHSSEQNPAYLKLVMMEQVLSARVSEDNMMATPAQSNPQKQAALMTAQQQQKKRQIQDAIKQKQQEIQALQKEMNNPTMSAMESRLARRRIAESEVQQAQVVLASQDMIDQVQKMIEQVTSMQFKDLPALVDQVKNQMGPDQAMQFNQDVTTALTGLTQNLQGSKTQLEGALGVVTGQAPVVPGEDLGAAPPADDLGGEELPPAPEGEEEVDIDAEVEEPIRGPGVNDLGRSRR